MSEIGHIVGRPFKPGRSGNPSGLPGRPLGSRTAFPAGIFGRPGQDLADKGRQTMEWTADNQVREVRLSAGAEFVVAICGEIMTMPGLPKVPAADSIDVGADGRITGLF